MDSIKKSVIFVGITGTSCSGKSTISQEIKRKLLNDGIKVKLIEQDDYFISMEEMEWIEDMKFHNWDMDNAINFDKLNKDLEEIVSKSEADESKLPTVIILDGHVILQDMEIRKKLDLKYFLSINYDLAKTRRKARIYDPPGHCDPPLYFEKYYWPKYLEYCQLVEKLDENTPFDDVSHRCDFDNMQQNILTDIRQMTDFDWVSISEAKISVVETTQFVTHPSCGAISSFCGTTRDNFDGKIVTRLIYEAYSPMALSKMRQLCQELREKYKEIYRIAMIHRVGEVPPPETSVIISVSSPHRLQALQAVHEAIDLLKAQVPIWKKEEYDDGTTNWKENCDCTWKQNS